MQYFDLVAYCHNTATSGKSLVFRRMRSRPADSSPSLGLLGAQPWGLEKAIVEKLSGQILVVDKLSIVV